MVLLYVCLLSHHVATRGGDSLRIFLLSYSILLGELSGYELLDNVSTIGLLGCATEKRLHNGPIFAGPTGSNSQIIGRGFPLGISMRSCYGLRHHSLLSFFFCLNTAVLGVHLAQSEV